jgi:type III pantothenate kinase
MTLCDIGNSTFHFLDGEKNFKCSLDEQIKSLQISTPIYYTSVNELGTKKLKNSFSKTIDLNKYLDLQTEYSQTLGSDRKLACIGFDDAIIVDFGSAITLDVMENGFHKGGFIMPGTQALADLYPQISSKLQFTYNDLLNMNILPNNTNDAITFGIHSMIIEPIKAVQGTKNLPLYITGEDGEFFMKYFSNATYKASLLFDNMKLVIQRNNI